MTREAYEDLVDQDYNTDFLSDAQFQDLSWTTQNIRDFLTAQGSYFANPFTDTDGTANVDLAVVISGASMQNHVSPKVLLATLQKESSGVTTSTRPSDTRMDSLMGVPNTPTAQAQVMASAQLFANYYSQASTGPTVSGWQLNTPKATVDGVVVTPASNPVAGQFTYTPYAGEGWGGNQAGVGGVYLF